MMQASSPFLTSLMTVAVGMLMLLAGVKKRRLAWRPKPVDRPRRGFRTRKNRP